MGMPKGTILGGNEEKRVPASPPGEKKREPKIDYSLTMK